MIALRNVFAGFEQKRRHGEVDHVQVAQRDLPHEGGAAFVAQQEGSGAIAPQHRVLDRDPFDVAVGGREVQALQRHAIVVAANEAVADQYVLRIGFNPFQPEVMDVFALLERYRGRLTFLGGLSTQQVLPFGTTDDVRRAAGRLLAAGQSGSYIFGPAHSVEGDVPPENMLALIDVVQSQAK